ncbi:MAG: transglutaminase domain protein [Planctomycetaceae bacterium]|nr:transglutaminase domain protein [Planctomycetaceae bacterium]
MDLAAAFYISVYSLAALAGGILAWAENVPSVTMLTAPIAIALLFLNERHRIIRLDGGWVALAGFAAFAFPAMEFFRGDEEYRLLCGAHLLAILQWVLLAYHKTAHQYWWVCALSCLQVAIAAVLTTSPVFGVLILIYMFWALWTLSLFTLLLARLRFGLSDQSLTQKSNWQWPELTRPAALPAESKRPPVSSSTNETSEKEVSRLREASAFRGTFQCEPHETDLSWRFVFGICGMSTMALILGLVLFLLTPRVWIGPVNPLQDETSSSGRGRNITGFSDNVRLNDFGKILESSAPVMEVKLIDDATNETLSLTEALRQVGQDEALFRGAALATYDRGQWIAYDPRSTDDIPTGPSPFRPQTVPLVRQEIRLEPTGTNALFTLGHPVYVKLEGAEKARRQKQTAAVSLPRGSMNGASRSSRRSYTVWSLKKGAENPYRLADGALAATYSLCPPSLELLPAYTRELLAPMKRSAGMGHAPSQTKIAQTLVAYLRDSGNFHYSLDRSVINPGLDPIEDFLINRKYGHCQYFAAALGLMLRVEGIPSCVITGFKGGIEDSERQLLEIQQRHAHAWVEAFLDGEWVTLDPTPYDGREEVVASVGDRMRFWHRFTAFATLLWNDYVINLTLSRQQQDLFGPAQELLQTIGGQTKEASSLWRGLAETASQFWSHPENWFSLQGGVVAFLFMLFLAGCFQLFRLAWRLYRNIWCQNTLAQRDSLRLEFHLRFLALLKPLGFVPAPTETQREFAALVAADWERLQLPAELQTIAVEVARAYDGVRFGRQPLPEAEKLRLLRSVERLELELRRPHSKTATESRQTHPPA